MYHLTFILLVLTCQAQSYNPTSALTKIDTLRLEFLRLEQKLWNSISEITNPNEKVKLNLLTLFKNYGDQLQMAFPYNLTRGLESIQDVGIWKKVYIKLRGVHALYERFRRFQSNQTAAERVSLPQQEWILLTKIFLQTGEWDIKKIHAFISDAIVKEQLYETVIKVKRGNLSCGGDETVHQILYNLYNAIEVTELKGYIMVQFSYMLLKIFGNNTIESQLMRNDERNISMAAVRTAMKKSSREILKCDPFKHVPSTTYFEITRLLQGYIVNQIDINSEQSCLGSCGIYNYVDAHNCTMNKMYYCKENHRCNGKLLNCTAIASDYQYCPANNASSRRFEYIKFKSGGELGKKNLSCLLKEAETVASCYFCFCTCDDKSDDRSDRYFNMRAQVSDIKNNKIVTGLRFAKRNRIIHVQIQEGKLLPYGEIDQESVRWVPVEEYKITDRYIYSGQDYYTLSWKQRTIDLDDLIADDNHLLTGVRFKQIGAHLTFEIHITPFDFETGELLDPVNRGIWKDADISSLNRTKLYLTEPDIPTSVHRPSKPISKSNQCIDFINTDKKRDAAQTTVPFLDAQPVVSKLPLAGAGLYYKGTKYSGGFIAPKIITFDFSQYLHAVFPADEVEINK